ncbi:uncharacterized protein K452DRAFT_309919 [Aplosporella prunicola CBS 121167]|uniref:Uncharacterized protein n=1 Tax=Aplosporella prunicola CBS 121167 TaxID=1176127 RepID=A0A6A6BB28_9PEZI|nr:uncharacterized protein K452DRAFT_309919 [Aplosporella prunicola CBS 121167]KAF2140127.1 hypothetical protein K452DRAFT_309919 [Aplosporella prunicola CBS 121167]
MRDKGAIPWVHKHQAVPSTPRQGAEIEADDLQFPSVLRTDNTSCATKSRLTILTIIIFHELHEAEKMTRAFTAQYMTILDASVPCLRLAAANMSEQYHFRTITSDLTKPLMVPQYRYYCSTYARIRTADRIYESDHVKDCHIREVDGRFMCSKAIFYLVVISTEVD